MWKRTPFLHEKGSSFPFQASQVKGEGKWLASSREKFLKICRKGKENDLSGLERSLTRRKKTSKFQNRRKTSMKRRGGETEICLSPKTISLAIKGGDRAYYNRQKRRRRRGDYLFLYRRAFRDENNNTEVGKAVPSPYS